VGVSGYFTNLNRERPRAADGAFVFYSLNPQVHAFDNLSLIETLPTQAETVRSARALYPKLDVAVTPITLRPRSHDADPRQRSLLCAGWTLGSIGSLAWAGAASLTYYQTAGPHGVVSEAGEPYPLYYLLKWLQGWHGSWLFRVSVSDPLRVAGLALDRFGQRRLILANLTDSPIDLAVSGVKQSVISHLDETTGEGEGICPSWPRPLWNLEDRIKISLQPYGLACVDWSV